MNRETILVAIIAVLIGGIVGYAMSERGRYHQDRWDNDYAKDRAGIPHDMHRMSEGTPIGDSVDSIDGMSHMMGMMVASERDFIEEMIPHHQEAVDTAKEVIERGGTTSEIKTLVENIVIAQEKEIAEMKQWYQSWYGVPYTDNSKYQPMMRELEALSGQELDKAFLSDMIMHHMGAIMMARSVEPYVEHEEMKKLTAAIVSTQSKEIQEMKRMLGGL